MTDRQRDTKASVIGNSVARVKKKSVRSEEGGAKDSMTGINHPLPSINDVSL